MDKNQKILDAAGEMAKVCDRLISEFNRNPIQPDLGQIVVNADRALTAWELAVKEPDDKPKSETVTAS